MGMMRRKWPSTKRYWWVITECKRMAHYISFRVCILFDGNASRKVEGIILGEQRLLMLRGFEIAYVTQRYRVF
jgi:hypothetical protein